MARPKISEDGEKWTLNGIDPRTKQLVKQAAAMLDVPIGKFVNDAVFDAALRVVSGQNPTQRLCDSQAIDKFLSNFQIVTAQQKEILERLNRLESAQRVNGAESKVDAHSDHALSAQPSGSTLV